MLRHTHPSRATGPLVFNDTNSFPQQPRRARLPAKRWEMRTAGTSRALRAGPSPTPGLTTGRQVRGVRPVYSLPETPANLVPTHYCGRLPVPPSCAGPPSSDRDSTELVRSRSRAGRTRDQQGREAAWHSTGIPFPMIPGRSFLPVQAGGE